jgi:hypothetical protein
MTAVSALTERRYSTMPILQISPILNFALA